MKIIFTLFNGSSFEMDSITEGTTLRDVKRYFEEHTGIDRADYSFIINNRKGKRNANSMMPFFLYLAVEHKLDISDDIIKVHILHPDLKQATLFHYSHRTDIAASTEDLPEADSCICPITSEVISGFPVLLNGHYYDYDALYRYFEGKREQYNIAGPSVELRCPFAIPLPPILKLAITLPSNEEAKDCLRKGLRSLINLEGYENKLATLVPSTVSSAY